MTDTSSNSIFTKSLEDSLLKILKLAPDEINPFVTSEIQTLLNRIAPEKKCIGFYLDYTSPNGVLVCPTYEEISNIGKYLFDFDNPTKSYQPNNYVVCLSKNIKFGSIREVVARILYSIDRVIFQSSDLINAVKAMILERGIENGMFNKEHGFTFKNGTSYNETCTCLIIPFITHLCEEGANPFKYSLLNLLIQDHRNNEESLVFKYGYLSDLDNIKDENYEKLKSANKLSLLFNSMWSDIMEYPLNKGRLIQLYNQVLSNKNIGIFEREIASKIKESLEKTNKSIFDSKLGEQIFEESVKSFLETKKRGFSLLEIEELKVEVEALNSSEDKMYLVTRIHRDIATALKAKEKLNSDIEKEEIDKYIAELKEILERIHAKKIRTKNDYRILVQYPEGDYEE